MTDLSNQFQQSVMDALEQNSPLAIKGSGSKDFYGREINGAPLSVIEHQGVINYEPKELVFTARSGTALSEIKAVLAEQGQMLAFEPPGFSDSATLGGTIACGFSGPRRPFAGAARDFVLGMRLINGRGEDLKFGGEVMKNVAGYDVSRLMVGALGTLGLILDVSLKVLPLPEEEITLTFEYDVDEAVRLMNEWAGTPLPVSAACHDGANLFVRLSGTGAGINAAIKNLGGSRIEDGRNFWSGVRELKHDFFRSKQPLWRISVPSDTPDLKLSGKQFIDWGGAQRWFIADDEGENIRQVVESHGGHAQLFRGGDRQGDIFHPLTPSLAVLHQQIKQAFDPKGIFNPGRLYREF